MIDFINEVFLNPWGLLGLATIPLVVLIYLLRSRYKTKSVSSTFIWKRSLKYVKRRIPLNFIMSLILILQILVVTVASFAIARPTIEPMETEEKIIILDASASMLAEKDGVTRFEEAKRQIKKAADKIGPNSKFTLILAGEEPVPVITRTMDKGDFLTKLEPVACTMKTANITKALEMAGEIRNENTGATIQIYTDKDFIDTDGIEVIDCKREGEWNTSVISLEENELFSGKEFITNIANYGLTSNVKVVLYVDGVSVASGTYQMEPDEIKQIRFSHTRVNEGKADEEFMLISDGTAVRSYNSAEVRISSTNATKDNFSYDDSMTIYPKEKTTPKIAYISKYVTWENGRKNANKSFLYFAITSAGYSVDPLDMFNNIDEVANIKGYDLYIYEGLTPYVLPTDGAVWLLDTKDALSSETGVVISDSLMIDKDNGYRIEKSLSVDVVEAIINNVNLDVPLMFEGEKRYASVASFYPITNLGNAFKPVYEAHGQNIMVAGNYNGARMIISSFDFSNSSLIAFVADFPVLVKNMVNYSIPDLLPERTAVVGSTIDFEFPAGSLLIERKYNDELINKIDVRLLMVELQDKLAKDPTFDINAALRESFEITLPGKYEVVVTYPDGDDQDLLNDTKHFYVTGYLPVEETAIVQRVPTGYLESPPIADGASPDYEREEIFPYVIAVLIALLIIEWGVYYREQY